MHFLPFVSTILATAVLVASQSSDQFDIGASDIGASPGDISYNGDLAGNFPGPPSAVAAPPGQLPAAGRQGYPVPGQQQTAPSPGGYPYGRPQQGPIPGSNPYGQQQQSPVPDGSTSPPSYYQGNQHCREYGGCPFECHTNCVCWGWCKNANCNLAPFGEQALTSAQISCDPSGGEKFIGKVCRPYCANWCEDMKNQITQALTSDQAQRAFLSKPLECDKNYYNCPGGPNPSGTDCLTPGNPLAPPGSGGLDKGDAKDNTEFSLDSWRK